MDIVVAIWCAALFFLAGLIIGRLGGGRDKVYAGEGAHEGLQENGQGEWYGRQDEWSGKQGRQPGTQENPFSVRQVRTTEQEQWGMRETSSNTGEKVASRFLSRKMFSGRDKKPVPGEKRIPLGWAIGSPVSGEVRFIHEGTGRGALIAPDQGVVFAPASGKITRLYPTGNAMRLRTDCGIELLIQAGIETGELEGRYYRPRIVQNEFVNKGKPLLEFDIEGIRSEGYDASVRMSVEEAQDYRDITICENTRVKAGENLLWVRR